MTHALKTWPEYFQQVNTGNKTFEVRKMDRPFKVGDSILLQEFDPITGQYTGKELHFNISYILTDAERFGIKKGYCVLSLKERHID